MSVSKSLFVVGVVLLLIALAIIVIFLRRRKVQELQARQARRESIMSIDQGNFVTDK